MCRLSIDLRGSKHPIDDLRAIQNCYSVIAGLFQDNTVVAPIDLAELLYILDSFHRQSINNLTYKESVTPDAVKKELLDISQKIGCLVDEKGFIDFWLLS